MKKRYLGIVLLVAACGLTACSSKNLSEKEHISQLPIVDDAADTSPKNEYSGVGYRFMPDTDWSCSEKKKKSKIRKGMENSHEKISCNSELSYTYNKVQACIRK